MAVAKNEKTAKLKRIISSKERLIFIIFSCAIAIAIICVSIFVVYPKFAGRPDWQVMGSLNFDDSTWIEDMVKNRVRTTDKAMDISSSFVYSTDTAYITYSYASSTSVADAKKFFLNQIPGAVDNKADSVSQLNIDGTLRGEKINIVDYQADVLNAFDVKVVLEEKKAEVIKQKLLAEYPVEVANNIPELAQIMKEEKLGGYVMYNDDELSSSSYPGIPIFSEAYRYSGSKDDLIAIEKALKQKYTDNTFFEDIGSIYFKDQGYIISLNYAESDQHTLAVITLQKRPSSNQSK
jgi:hypothetical protein